MNILCSSDLSSGTNKTKRRKSFGESSKTALEVLDIVSVCHFGQILSNSHLSHESYIRHKCKCKAESFGVLVNKPQTVEKEIITLVNITLPGSKRRRSSESSNTGHRPLPKKSRMEDEVSKFTMNDTSMSTCQSTPCEDKNSAVSVSLTIHII